MAASSTFRSPACGGSLCLRTWRTPWTEIHSTFSSNSIFRAERWMWRKSFFFLIMRICEGGSSWRLLPAQKHQQPGILSFARVYLFSYDILAFGGDRGVSDIPKACLYLKWTGKSQKQKPCSGASVETQVSQYQPPVDPEARAMTTAPVLKRRES